MRHLKFRAKTWFTEYLGRPMNSGSLGQNRISGNIVVVNCPEPILE
ncbi:Unknown protein sequence [Pseudomonas syringae pv. maculicola]|nr:Unknown protein sequence [Pseudomonas syringae pv. maculicola]